GAIRPATSAIPRRSNPAMRKEPGFVPARPDRLPAEAPKEPAAAAVPAIGNRRRLPHRPDREEAKLRTAAEATGVSRALAPPAFGWRERPGSRRELPEERGIGTARLRSEGEANSVGRRNRLQGRRRQQSKL